MKIRDTRESLNIVKTKGRSFVDEMKGEERLDHISYLKRIYYLYLRRKQFSRNYYLCITHIEVLYCTLSIKPQAS
jgi:hypothetical protein